MRFEETLAAERQRREAAEAEVARLRARLLAVTTDAGQAHLASGPAHDLARVLSQLRHTEGERDLVRQVIDTSPNLVYVKDGEGRLILANRSYTELLARQPRRARPAGADPETPWPSDTTAAFEESYHFPDGQVSWYHTTKSPLVRTDGARYLLTFSSDITDLKQAHRVAEESVRAKQVFMANMSHEIRTPLHGVMGLAELLKKETLSAEQADYVEMIHSSTENLLVVINDILDFARIEAGQLSLERIPFDIARTVQEAMRALRFKTDEKGLLLRVVSPDEPLPLALGDPFRLRQVLVNLISNAIKFTPQGAITVTIDASRRNGAALPVTFSVADTGIGIGEEHLGAVFDSFRQADSSIPRLYGGTGLGLSICKNLVELQGGHIGVRSAPGQGSCFTFTLPYSVSAQPLAEEPTLQQQPDLLRGLAVLLAEDNAVNQLIAVSMLGQWQVRVDIAHNGEDALAKALLHRYDLILMDIQMPQLDGLEATVRLRALDSPNRDTPVIAITADAIRVNDDTFQRLGFAEFLTKPYSERALYQMLAQVSGRADALPAQTSPPAPPAADAPAVPAAETGRHYDFLLLGRLATDAEFIRKMLELFVARVPGQAQALLAAVEGEEWEAVAREAHSLKSIFGSLNIQPETGHLKRLETLAEARAPRPELLPVLLPVLEAARAYTRLFTQELAQLLQDT